VGGTAVLEGNQDFCGKMKCLYLICSHVSPDVATSLLGRVQRNSSMCPVCSMFTLALNMVLGLRGSLEVHQKGKGQVKCGQAELRGE
jgi:hypothetical protein